MNEEVKVPLLPESVNDAIIAKWHYQVGDYVQEGDVIAELETDKIMLEVPAVKGGVIKEVLKSEASHVASNEVICIMDTAADKPQAVEKLAQKSDKQADVQAAPADKLDCKMPEKSQSNAGQMLTDCKKSPSVRRSMHAQGIKDSAIKTQTDSMQHLQQAEKPAQVASLQRESRRVPMTRLRQTIAKRLMESQQTTASLTTFNEVDLSKIIDLRARYKDEFNHKYGVKLGFMSFFTKACCHALLAFPEVNASVDGQDIIYHDYCDIGIAVSTDKGLMVPIIRNAEALDMAGVEANILNYAQRAKENKITLDDLTGGTFSITNGGVFGSMLSTPILNPPQSAILGMHNIVKRPIAVDNAVVIRPMMYIALTYDHRIIDGSQAVRFLVMVKELLEDPDRLLLQI